MIAVDVRDFCIPSDENDYDELVAFADTMANIPRFDVLPIEVLDEIRSEIENDWQLKEYPSSPFSCGLRRAIEIIDKELEKVGESE